MSKKLSAQFKASHLLGFISTSAFPKPTTIVDLRKFLVKASANLAALATGSGPPARHI
ncbi:MAG: hypothetical protein QF843_05510 [Candidatus Thalassarchaeaceae archaeon]|nr:hypothetical protein [Candidatus Thalassarchaeaceae archaeon]